MAGKATTPPTDDAPEADAPAPDAEATSSPIPTVDELLTLILDPKAKAELRDSAIDELKMRAEPDTLIESIAAAMLEAREVTKSSLNQEQGYKFASAEAILAAVRLPLLKRGVILTAQPTQYVPSEITSRNGNVGTHIAVAIDYTFRNGAGEELAITGWRGEGQDYGDKALGKAYTNAIKTFVRTQWLLPTEHDDPEGSPSGDRVARESAGPPAPAWARDATGERRKKLVEELEPFYSRDVIIAACKGMADAWGTVPDGLVAFAIALRQFSDAARERAAGPPPADLPPDAPSPEPAADPPSPAEQPDAPAPEDEPIPTVEESLAKLDEDELQSVIDTDPADHVRSLAQDEQDRRRASTFEPDPPAPAPRPPEGSGAPAPLPETTELPPAPAAPPASVSGPTATDLKGKSPQEQSALFRHDGCICSTPLASGSGRDQACPIIGHGVPLS